MTGIVETTGLTALISGFIGQIIKSGWEGVRQNELLNKDVGQIVRERKYLFLKEYAERYWNRHGMIKVLKISKPMNLESIYINVKCLEDLVRDYYEENLENKYRESKQRRFSFRDNEKQDGLVFANQEQYLMVFGGPGIGKSTFLRKIGLEALKGNQGSYQHHLTPVLLELKNFKETQINIQTLIEEEFRICGFPNIEKNIRKKLEKGELLILLDGLDEVPSDNISDVVKKIQDFVDLYDKNRFVISCRTALQKRFNRFTNIEIVEYDDQQIQSFIKNWFSFELKENNRTGQNCWELLQKEEYKSAKELCQTPLLLTFLCVIYQKKQSFPTDRSNLYQEALELLLEEWAKYNDLQEHRSIDKKMNINLSVKIEKLLLSKIAYDNFLEDKLFFWKEDIVNQLEYNLQETLNFSQNPDGNKVLKTIEIEQGILVERAKNQYSFSHLTLQEYLTARYIVENDLYENIVKNYLTETRWHEVFLLISGLLRGKVDQLFKADHLLLAMEKEAARYLKTSLGKSKLVPILQWVDEITKDYPDSPLKPFERRIVAFFYGIPRIFFSLVSVDEEIFISDFCSNKSLIIADIVCSTENNEIVNQSQRLRSRAIQLKHSQVFSNVDFQFLITNLDNFEASIPNEKLMEEQNNQFFNKLLEIWRSAFFLGSDLCNLNSSFIKDHNISKYLYAYLLIKQCKESMVNISPSVWQEIEDRMLRVP
jgi:predicted NACHT family NTPase